MPTFHFQLEGDAAATALELEDLASAKCESLLFASRHICNAANSFWDRVEWTLTVTDEKHLTLFQLQIVGTESPATSSKGIADELSCSNSADPTNDPKIMSNGEHTIVDIEIEGKPRRVSVSREWIENRLGLPSQRAADFSTDQRTEFIRTHLDEIVEAAKGSRGTSSIADLIFVHTRDFD